MFFKVASLNGEISKWDVSNVTNMHGIFAGATSFKQSTYRSGTYHARVANMSSMFSDAKSFNGDISKWDVSRVANMSCMFLDAKSFNNKSFVGLHGSIQRQARCSCSRAYLDQYRSQRVRAPKPSHRNRVQSSKALLMTCPRPGPCTC